MTPQTEAGLRAALKSVEWIEQASGPGMIESVCAWCHGDYPKHRKDCERQAALSRSGQGADRLRAAARRVLDADTDAQSGIPGSDREWDEALADLAAALLEAP